MFPLIIPVVIFIGEQVAGAVTGKAIDTVLTEPDTTGAALSNLQSSVDTINAGLAHQSTMLSAIQSSIGAIGMASTIGCALSAVNVVQLIKVQRSLNRIEKKLEDGFLDLKVFFAGELQNLLEQQQKQRLSQAYSYYRKGLEQLQTTLLVGDESNKKHSFAQCIAIFTQSLSIYDDRSEYEHTNLPAKLRRLECCWSIQASIAETYCLQTEYSAGLHSYKKLHTRMLQDINHVKGQLNEENHHFVARDVGWLFENDMKLLASKIQLLDAHRNKQVLVPKAYRSRPLDEAEIEKMSKRATEHYLSCLISPKMKKQLLESVLKSEMVEDVKQLSLLKACSSYDQLNRFLSVDYIQQQLCQLVEEFMKERYKSSNMLCLNDISEKKLNNAYDSYAPSARQEKSLLLIDMTRLGSTSKGLLITTERIYSSYLELEDKFARLDEIYQISYCEIKKECILSINQHEQFAKIGDCTPTVMALLREIVNKLYTIWAQRGSILSNLGRKDEAIEAFTIATQLHPNEVKQHAFWFAKVGAYQKARQQLEKLNSVKEQESVLYVYVLLKLKEYEQAITYLKKALPQDATPQNYLQWFYVGVLVNHRAYEEANMVLQAITPKDEALAFSAMMLIKVQKTEDVLKIINQVVRKSVDSTAVKHLSKATHFTPEMLFLGNLQGETELDLTWLIT